MANVSISSLYTSVTKYCDELKNRGFETSVDVFKSGSFGHPSYVELEIEKDGDWTMFRILANGYNSVQLTHISTNYGWAKAKGQIEFELTKIF